MKLNICALLIVFVTALSWGTVGANAHGVQASDMAAATTAEFGSDDIATDGTHRGGHGQHGKKGGMNGGHCSFACMAMLDKAAANTTIALRVDAFAFVTIEATAVATEPPRRPPKHILL